MVASHMPPTGDLAHNAGMCPEWELNRRPFGSQADTQSPEPHQPGPVFLYPLTLLLHSVLFSWFIDRFLKITIF